MGEVRDIVYASAQSHSTVEQASLLAGFGRDNVRLINTDEDYSMRVDRSKRITGRQANTYKRTERNRMRQCSRLPEKVYTGSNEHAQTIQT
jgi:glutamate/tyrosine decarboxylase-like PLP-dependent enzyme